MESPVEPGPRGFTEALLGERRTSAILCVSEFATLIALSVRRPQVWEDWTPMGIMSSAVPNFRLVENAGNNVIVAVHEITDNSLGWSLIASIKCHTDHDEP